MRGPSAHEQLERKLQSQEKEELDSLVRSEEFRKQQVRSLKQRNMYEAARAVEQQPGVYMDPNMLGSDQVRQINENWHSKGKVSVTKDVE
jgi:glucan phosphorylase